MALSFYRQNGPADYDLNQRIAAESQATFITEIDRTLTAPGSGLLQLVSITASPGKMGFIRSVTVGCWNKGLNVQVSCGSALYGGNPVVARASIRQGGGTVTIPLDYWLFEGQTLAVNAVGPLPEAVDETNPYIIQGHVNNIMFTQELKFDSKETILALGDSITAGNAVSNSPYTHTSKDVFMFQVRDFLRSKGRDIRLVNWGLPGYSSTYFRTPMESGRFNGCNPTIITYCHGVNDVSGSWDASVQAAYESNINYAIDWKKSLYPRAKMIFFGPPPQGDAKEARVQNFRNFLQTRIADIRAAGDNTFFYCNLGTAFTPSDMTKYNDAGTHPNKAGNIAIATVIKNFITANNI
ncbi:MAG: SGNH/GDSL hydrolase family protein [Siphonobacter aquaeclarae]|nr:SGNH/GDSL hydrolase family protein [Siphonobacter aquaeclarae]